MTGCVWEVWPARYRLFVFVCPCLFVFSWKKLSVSGGDRLCLGGMVVVRTSVYTTGASPPSQPQGQTRMDFHSDPQSFHFCTFYGSSIKPSKFPLEPWIFSIKLKDKPEAIFTQPLRMFSLPWLFSFYSLWIFIYFIDYTHWWKYILVAGKHLKKV